MSANDERRAMSPERRGVIAHIAQVAASFGEDDKQRWLTTLESSRSEWRAAYAHDVAELVAALEASEAENERLRSAILDIDAHAAPMGSDEDGFVSGGYVLSIGCLHRALGLVGHSAGKQREHAVQLVTAHGKKCDGCEQLKETCLDAVAQARRTNNYELAARGSLVGELAEALRNRIDECWCRDDIRLESWCSECRDARALLDRVSEARRPT